MVLAVGFRFSRKFRRRGRFITGLIAVAASLISFWGLQVVVALQIDNVDLLRVLQITAFITSVSVLGLGMQLMAASQNTARDDYYDTLFR